jgi:hypothetical protein
MKPDRLQTTQRVAGDEDVTSTSILSTIQIRKQPPTPPPLRPEVVLLALSYG